MTHKRMTRYQPIVDHLAACAEREIILSMNEIETLIGRPLPDTAYTASGYWISENMLYIQRWRALGWRARLDRRNRCVIFTRTIEE